ncbi:hypothetical protein SLEP1_g46470 [Rubroshorea leprosula]|uniref:Uncharacterized protein n=1 Tax=Rubroshorea leprosula TaxID=152421 RepID=A0AAV5LN94_9ROSI|nr:hypothetical protein SLEP1_g46470 [Rubroshorea leprosula]
MEDNNSPRIRDVPLENRHELFMDKLNCCSEFFHFRPFIQHFKAKQSLSDIRQSGVASSGILAMIETVFKRDGMLKEMGDYVLTLESLPDDAVCLIMKMLRSNLFRPFPSQTAVFSEIENENLYDTEDKRPLVEGAWVHLRNFYEFLQKIVDAGLLREEHIEDGFITWFFNTAVQADDYREACFVADLLPTFWAKFPKKQQSIWRTVRSNLSRYVADRESCIPSAVGNQLQFVSNRIPEWPVPLREEQTHFLRLVLIPMHRIKAYPSYSSWLQKCLVRFLEKEGSLVNLIFEGILSGDHICESSLLNEIKALMAIGNINEINQSNAELLFGCIAKTLRSSDKKVVRKGLDIASSDRFLELAEIHRELSLPVIRMGLQCAIENNSARAAAKHILEKFYNVEDAF